MRIYRQFIMSFISMFILGFLFNSSAQNVVSIESSKDNTLYEDASGMLSNGAGQHMFAGNTASGSTRRAVVAFDISGNVPSGSVVDSVRFTLFMSKTSNSAGPQSVSLHRLLNDWGEGSSDAPDEEGAGVAATTGDATWIHTFYNTSLWSTAGGDFSGTGSATITVDGNGFYSWGNTSALAADVQGWLDNPGSNFGWAVIGNEGSSTTAKRFDTRENPVQGNRPVLQVFYSIPNAIGGISDVAPEHFQLYQNYPNPFNPKTTIRFAVAQRQHVRISVYDLTGREMMVLLNGVRNAGEYKIDFSADNLPSGVYFYEMVSGDFSQVRRMVLLK